MSLHDNLCALYSQSKADWMAQHPNATPEQIERACQDIAKRLGL